MHLFQHRVLGATFIIPRGKVATYGGRAWRFLLSGGVRSVGTALARNPFPLSIPCHCVVCTGGNLEGFSGGFTLKRALLAREGITFDDRGRFHPEHIL